MLTQKLLVKKILEKPHSYEWTLQGLGMFRLYLSEQVRLHLWDPTQAFKGASPIHTHPWDFESQVVVGEIKNVKYLAGFDTQFATHYRQILKCGTGGGLVGSPKECVLVESSSVEYSGGQWYSEEAQEIHQTHPARGTVTIVTRSFQKDRDHACVFWPIGQTWGSAEPRIATGLEVETACRFSLEKWFW